MATNEVGDVVPPEVEAVAYKLGCRGGVSYVYREGRYGEYPVASVGGYRAKRFGSDQYKRFKKVIYPGWVVFTSPTSQEIRDEKKSKYRTRKD